MLRVTPIYGSRWSDKGAAVGPQCTLVEYADCRVLLNVGWTAAALSSSEDGGSLPQLPPHDALILTDSTLESIGGLPLYYRQWQERHSSSSSSKKDGTQPDTRARSASSSASSSLPPIFATFPVVKMGQMTLYDYHAAICMDGGKPPFTLQDVDTVFGATAAIKYSHPQQLTPSQQQRPTLTITARKWRC